MRTPFGCRGIGTDRAPLQGEMGRFFLEAALQLYQSRFYRRGVFLIT